MAENYSEIDFGARIADMIGGSSDSEFDSDDSDAE